VLAWNDDGDGVVLQVTTLGVAGLRQQEVHAQERQYARLHQAAEQCSERAALLLREAQQDDVVHMLDALENSSVVTDVMPGGARHNGGPQEIKDRVKVLGQKSDSTEVKQFKLSTGILLVSKPSALHVPPWQMLSSVLDSVDLKPQPGGPTRRFQPPTDRAR